MARIDAHYVFRPLLWLETECGDIGLILNEGEQCFVALIDALGHGADAFAVACRARDYLDEHRCDELVGLMRGLHEHLKGGKGAVAALCRIDVASGELAYVGIGNIAVKVVGPRPLTLVPRDGVLGYMIPGPREQRLRLSPGDTLLMYSDGIREHFSSLDCADLLAGSAQFTAQGILERFGKRDDDASCIALKYLP